MISIRYSSIKIIVLLVTCLLEGYVIGGCSTEKYNPQFWHTNFVTILRSNVGKKLENARGTGWALTEAFVDRTDLSNGNTAYRYRAGGSCRYTFEVDPNDIIVDARWEGEATHCIIIP